MAKVRTASRPPTPTLTQNSVETCSSEISWRWMVTIDRPAVLKRSKMPVTAVTMATRPKSLGSSSLAKTMRDPVRRTKDAAWVHILMNPPRTALVLR